MPQLVHNQNYWPWVLCQPDSVRLQCTSFWICFPQPAANVMGIWGAGQRYGNHVSRKDVDTNLIHMTVSKHWDRTREFQQACDSDWWNGWVNENNIFVLKSHLCRTSFPKALHFFALHHHVKISNMLLRQAPTSPAFFKCIKFVPFTRSPFLIACTALKKKQLHWTQPTAKKTNLWTQSFPTWAEEINFHPDTPVQISTDYFLHIPSLNL